jgi:hypothetical protein
VKVRLELDIQDEDEATRLAADLVERYVRLHPRPGEPWHGARVEIVPDAAARREHDLITAASHFWRQP